MCAKIRELAVNIYLHVHGWVESCERFSIIIQIDIEVMCVCVNKDGMWEIIHVIRMIKWIQRWEVTLFKIAKYGIKDQMAKNSSVSCVVIRTFKR